MVAQEFWNVIGTQFDKGRLEEQESEWLKSFMLMKETEKEIFTSINETLKWRESENIIAWQAQDCVPVFKTPFLQLHGRTHEGLRVLWKNAKYANPSELEVSKKAMAYYFELLSRGEPNKPVSIMINTFVELTSTNR